jgi:hypothetical protein
VGLAVRLGLSRKVGAPVVPPEAEWEQPRTQAAGAEIVQLRTSPPVAAVRLGLTALETKVWMRQQLTLLRTGAAEMPVRVALLELGPIRLRPATVEMVLSLTLRTVPAAAAAAVSLPAAT